MNTPIRIAINGYGNLGRGVELALAKAPDLALAGIFTRRDPRGLKPETAGAKVFAASELDARRDDIDVLILCGGSKDDLPEQGPALAARFNTVDSFDTHARIPEYFAAVNRAARDGGHSALISCGWDPGLFSLNRVYGEALLPDGDTYTFWGRGVSQGHSEAVHRIPGVAAAVQYTVPSEAAVTAARSGTRPQLTTRDRHTRECFVVLKAGAEPEAVRRAIVTMPHYFDEYDTTVHYISMAEFERDHQAMPHGGFVIRTGATSDTHKQLVEYRIQLDSNPEFTGSVLVAYARAVHRLHAGGHTGALTVLDVPPGLLSPKSADELRRTML
ncbi:MAG: diaminopimelate dehydrogenase [Nevskiaceae bacterium]|nr:MAG: diaminopimelate dehydrogenase [Nevskiaceae bacterium]TBR73551.1 MAG: diaminopimelate dehydrogenase [Nevskiaceae bacterium]